MFNFLSGLGQIGSGIAGLMGGDGPNPADIANQRLSNIPGQTKPYYEPWFQSGQRQLPGLEEQYSQGMKNPGGRMNEIGQSFQQSPGFKFALQQALNAGNQGAAAGGMAGSPMHEQNNMQMANDMASADYNKWMENALGLYGNAMKGSQGMANQGQQAGSSMADQIAQMLATQAGYDYEGQKAKNEGRGNAFGDILSGIGSMFF